MPRLHPKARSPIPAHAPAPAAHAHAAARIPPEHGPGPARKPPQAPGAAELHGGLLRGSLPGGGRPQERSATREKQELPPAATERGGRSGGAPGGFRKPRWRGPDILLECV